MEQKTSNQRGTFNLMCYLKKSGCLKNGEAPIYMRITVNRQLVSFSLQGSVLPSLWSQEKEKSKGKDKKAQELNYYIESVKSRLYAIHRELEIDGKTISAQIIKDIFLGNVTTEEDTGKSLVEVHTEHNERCRKLINTEYSSSTIYKFDASLKFLKLFMKEEYDKEDIPLSKLNPDFIQRYHYPMMQTRLVTRTVAITTDAESWNATTDAAWIELVRQDDILKVSVSEENTAPTPRSTNIKITAGNAPEITLVVTQAAVMFLYSEPVSLSFKANEIGEKLVNIFTNATNWNATADSSWMKLIKQNNMLKVITP